MARPCRICTHDSRAAIEQAILNGKTASGIARDFGFTYTIRTGEQAGTLKPDHRIVTRHRDDHMGQAYTKAMEARELESGDAIVTRLRFLDEQVDTVITRCQEGLPLTVEGVPLLKDDGTVERMHDNRLLLAAVREARGNAELALKLSGRTETDPTELEKLRTGIKDPKVRKLLLEAEAALAEAEAAAQGG